MLKLQKDAPLGRITGWTSAKRRALCDLLRNGCTITGACGELRLSRGHFYDWMRAGEADDASPEEREFYLEVTQALGELENTVASTFKAHTIDDWRACEAFLKRRFREDWAEPKVKHADDGQQIEEELTQEQWAALHELIGKRL